MGIFGKISRPSRVRQCSDSISLTTENKFKGLAQAILKRGQKDCFLLVVAHFQETFFRLQDALEEHKLDYQIVDSPITADKTMSWLDPPRPGSIHLALASLLDDSDVGLEQTVRKEGSLIVAERHPNPVHDRTLLRFAQQAVCPLRLGYFIALRDPAVQPLIGDWAELVLKQLGMQEHELITSQLVSRRLELGYRKIERAIVEERPAESQQEWLDLNYPKLRKQT